MLREESSKRCEMVAKSRVKPANMFMLRSRPRTSERITVSLSAGAEVDGESEGGIAGPRLGLFKGRCSWCCWARTEAADVAASNGYIKLVTRILMLSLEILVPRCAMTT